MEIDQHNLSVNPWIDTGKCFEGVITQVIPGTSIARLFILKGDQTDKLFNADSSTMDAMNLPPGAPKSSIPLRISTEGRAPMDLQTLGSMRAARDGCWSLCDTGINVPENANSMRLSDYRQASGPSHIMWVSGVFPRQIPFFITKMYPMLEFYDDTEKLSSAKKRVRVSSFQHTLPGAGRSPIDVMRVVTVSQYIPASFLHRICDIDVLASLCAHLGVFDPPMPVHSTGSSELIHVPSRYNTKRTDAVRRLEAVREAVRSVVNDGAYDLAAFRASDIRGDVMVLRVAERLRSLGALQGTGEFPILLASEWERVHTSPTIDEFMVNKKVGNALNTIDPEVYRQVISRCSDRVCPLELFFLPSASVKTLTARDRNRLLLSARDDFAQVLPARFILGSARTVEIRGSRGSQNGIVTVPVSTADFLTLQETLQAAQQLMAAMMDMFDQGLEAVSHAKLLSCAGVIDPAMNGDQMSHHAERLLMNVDKSKVWSFALHLLTTGEFSIIPTWRIPNPPLWELSSENPVVQLRALKSRYQIVDGILGPFLRVPASKKPAHSSSSSSSSSSMSLVCSSEIIVSGTSGESDDECDVIDPSFVPSECVPVEPQQDQANTIGQLYSKLLNNDHEVILQPYVAWAPESFIGALTDICDPAVVSGKGDTRYRPRMLVLSAEPAHQRSLEENFYSVFTAAEELTPAICSKVRVLLIIGAENLDLETMSAIMTKLFVKGTHNLVKIVLAFDNIVIGSSPTLSSIISPSPTSPVTPIFCQVVEAFLRSRSMPVCSGIPFLPADIGRSIHVDMRVRATGQYRKILGADADSSQSVCLEWWNSSPDHVEYEEKLCAFLDASIAEQVKFPVLCVNAAAEGRQLLLDDAQQVATYPRALGSLMEETSRLVSQIAEMQGEDFSTAISTRCPQMYNNLNKFSAFTHGTSIVNSNIIPGSYVSWVSADEARLRSSGILTTHCQPVVPGTGPALHASIYRVAKIVAYIDAHVTDSNSVKISELDRSAPEKIWDLIVAAGLAKTNTSSTGNRRFNLQIYLDAADGLYDTPDRTGFQVTITLTASSPCKFIPLPVVPVTVVSVDDLASIYTVPTMMIFFDTCSFGTAGKVLQALKHCSRRAIIITDSIGAAKQLLSQYASSAIPQYLSPLIPGLEARFPLATAIRSAVISNSQHATDPRFIRSGRRKRSALNMEEQ